MSMANMDEIIKQIQADSRSELEAERDRLKAELERVKRREAALRSAVMARICGFFLPEYLRHHFPATIGNIPLREHLDAIRSALVDSGAIGNGVETAKE